MPPAAVRRRKGWAVQVHSAGRPPGERRWPGRRAAASSYSHRVDRDSARPGGPRPAVYRVTCRFRPDGPVNSGWWADRATAELRYREWVGLYGSDPGTVITLARVTGQTVEVLRSWPPGPARGAGAVPGPDAR